MLNNTKYALKIEIQGLPKTTNGNARRHWRSLQNEANKWKREVALFIGNCGPVKPLERATLKLTRHSSAEPDYDGLVSSFKHVIDGLVRSGVLVNDKLSNIGVPDYKWARCARNKGFISVEVLEVE